MIKFFKYILLFASLAASFKTYAQATSSSPYSQYGLGNIKGPFLPQNRAMGGIAVGLRNIGPVFNNINLANPASYSDIHLTTFDIGASSAQYQLSKTNITRKTFNATLSHLLFAIPVNKKSALSFGIVPFSDLGYKFKVSSKIDTNNIDHIYSGEGGLAKAYIGYGILLGKHLSLGINTGYLFGKLDNTRSTEIFNDYGALNSRTQNSNSIGGLNFDFGVQYFTNISSKTTLTLGYTANAEKKINSVTNVAVTHYRKNYELDNEFSAADTLIYTAGSKIKINLPKTQTIGFSLQDPKKWLVGADFSMTNWSAYREGNTNPGLKNSYSFAAGGQFTPDINSLNYLKVIDYRLGFKYDKTYININNTDIHQKALTIGLGIPLPSYRTTYYKINFATEIGTRGTLNNNLVRERFKTFYIGFMLNDRWFQKVKFD